MSKYSFVVNVDKAIDIEHFKMFFLEEISNKRISLYHIDDLADLKDRAVHIAKHINRNAFEADENELVVCVSRKWTRNMPFNWWTLFIKKYISSCFSEKMMSHFSQINILILDHLYEINDEEKEVVKNIDVALLDIGVTDRVNQSITCPLTLDNINNIYNEYSNKSNEDFQEYKKSIEKEFGESGYHDYIFKYIDLYNKVKNTEADSYESSFIDVYKEQYTSDLVNKLGSIHSFVMEIESADSATKILSQLKFVKFVLTVVKEKKANDRLEDIYQRLCKEFNPSKEAARLKAYISRITEVNKKYDKKNDQSELILSFDTIPTLRKIQPNEFIGSDDDLDDILQTVMSFKNKEDWEIEFEELLKKVSGFEESLEAYGKEKNEEFHRSKSDKIVHSEPRYKTVKDAEKEINKEYEEAAEDAYKPRFTDNNTYSATLDITNQFNKVGSNLRRLNEIKKQSNKKLFIRTFLVALIAMIVPYTLMQTYIISGLLSGNIAPIICIGAFMLTFLLARPIAVMHLNHSLKMETEKLKSLVQRYFDEIRERQILFHDEVNSMIKMWNCEQKIAAYNKGINEKQSIHTSIDYHKRELKKYENMLKYFTSFISNMDDIDEYASAVLPGETDIDESKDSIDNAVYWINKIA